MKVVLRIMAFQFSVRIVKIFASIRNIGVDVYFKFGNEVDVCQMEQDVCEVCKGMRVSDAKRGMVHRMGFQSQSPNAKLMPGNTGSYGKVTTSRIVWLRNEPDGKSALNMDRDEQKSPKHINDGLGVTAFRLESQTI